MRTLTQTHKLPPFPARCKSYRRKNKPQSNNRARTTATTAPRNNSTTARRPKITATTSAGTVKNPGTCRKSVTRARALGPLWWTKTENRTNPSLKFRSKACRPSRTRPRTLPNTTTPPNQPIIPSLSRPPTRHSPCTRLRIFTERRCHTPAQLPLLVYCGVHPHRAKYAKNVSFHNIIFMCPGHFAG